jgi:hypothetical protein
MCQISHPFSLAYVIGPKKSIPKALCDISQQACFYGKKLLTPNPTPKLKEHPLLAVHDCLFNIFTTTHHVWRLSPPSTT